MQNTNARYEVPKWVPHNFKGPQLGRSDFVYLMAVVVLMLIGAMVDSYTNGRYSWLRMTTSSLGFVAVIVRVLYVRVMGILAKRYLNKVWRAATGILLPAPPRWRHKERYKDMLRELTVLARWADNEERVENFRRARAVVAVILWKDSRPWCTCCPESVPDIRTLKKQAGELAMRGRSL